MARGPKKSEVFVTCPQCGNDKLKPTGLVNHMRACAKKLGIAKAAEELKQGLSGAGTSYSTFLQPEVVGVCAARCRSRSKVARLTDTSLGPSRRGGTAPLDPERPQDAASASASSQMGADVSVQMHDLTQHDEGRPSVEVDVDMPDAPPPLIAIFDDLASSSTSSSGNSPSTSAADDLPLPTFQPPTLRNAPSEILVDDFLTVPHPHSGRAPTIDHFEDFNRSAADLDPSQLPEKPHHPFNTLEDFDFADFTRRTSLNQGEINTLLALIHRICDNPSSLTFKTAKDVNQAWEIASHIAPSYRAHTVTKKYGTEDVPRSFTFYYRPLFEWGLSLLRDPILAYKFAWDAIRLFKYNGQEWERFIDEPHTADGFWHIQSALPIGAGPLCFIVYADKTRLSSFGTQKGYPIMARIANLPAEIRNGTGYGGGQVVGFLPVVEDKNAEGDKEFTTYKRIIWHESFWVLLEQVALYAKTGYKFRCGDNIERILYPIILILVADYEEQAIMSLTRGANGLFPCPVCLVPRDKQIILGIQPLFPLRQPSDGQAILTDATLSKTELKSKLKELSLRPVWNVFWKIPHCNVYRALSWDRLHAYHGGLFSDHLFDQFQQIVAGLEKACTTKINDQADAIPSWPNLNHFTSICSVTYTDGKKYEDISKIIVHASYNVLSRDTSPQGYLLLQCIRLYVILDILAGLKVQTGHTLKMYATQLVSFSAAIQNYARQYPAKNWNFPKAHTHQHLIDDIIWKGVTAVFNAKLFEAMHVPLKTIYADQTNFKEVEAQEDPFQFSMIHLGSKQAPVTLAQLEATNRDDFDFTRFRLRLEEYFNSHFPDPGRKWIRLNAQEQITEMRYLRIDYESVVTWRLETDHLRCSPAWRQNEGRWDHIIYRIGRDKTIGFAQLIFVFLFTFNGIQYPTALISTLDVVRNARRSTRDHDLGLCHVRRRQLDTPTRLEFIPITWILRGALVLDDFNSTTGDAFVIDTVDGDMFLRLKRDVPLWNT
ncbi:hypothetical protein BV20DRAFT_1046355 [Pilatotrama ljubarskyi]|nr:hypothetical protein BV20DRAFT_1046355 [Pilatotrama ljubarskyi]